VNVLVTGAGALLGQGIIRSLRASTLDLHIVAADPHPTSAGLYWADAAHLIPTAHDLHYADAVRFLLERERPDAVLIGTDVELALFAEHRAAWEEEFGTHILVSSTDVIRIADDKWLTYRWLRRNGFPYPASSLPADVERLIETVGFPLVVRPRIGARSIGVQVVKNRAQLRHAVAAVEDPVIQEEVGTAADEYTAGVLFFSGQNPVSIVMRRDLRDGNTYRAYPDAYPELNAAVQTMARALEPHGPTVFEINGRFSGTTPLRALAGFNEVYMALRHVLHAEPLAQPEIQPMAILRHWSETVVPLDAMNELGAHGFLAPPRGSASTTFRSAATNL
jgi:carbamoyl-phosphate synthase large subunit